VANPYYVSIQEPAAYGILSPTPTVGIVYDVSQEYPNEPLKSLAAWVNVMWKVTGVYPVT